MPNLRVKLDPGGNNDFRYATWTRLESLQPSHQFDREKRCLQELHTRQLQESYLKELQQLHCCPPQQETCQGQHYHPSCLVKNNAIPFQRPQNQCNYNNTHNSHPHCHPLDHHPHHNPQQLPYHQYNFYNQQRVQSQAEAHRRYQQGFKHRMEQDRINRQPQQCTNNPRDQRLSGMSSMEKKGVFIGGREYCLNQHPFHPHDFSSQSCPVCEAEMFPNNNCPPPPDKDLMEPRQYLLTQSSWKGVPFPFSDPRYELLIPGNRDPLSLLPSSNPFEYVGRKTNWTEPRLDNPPATQLPITAKRPEVTGYGSGVALTTNRLGYRPQRRHYREPISMIVYN